MEPQLDYIYVKKAVVRRRALAVLLLVAASWALWRLLTHEPDPAERAAEAIRSAESLVAQAREAPQARRFPDELEIARVRIAEARAYLERGDPVTSLERARTAQKIAIKIVQAGGPSDAHILAVGGKVEVKRTGSDRYEDAREGWELFAGDFVKTGPTGSARIVSTDGTDIVVKPDSLFEVLGPERVPAPDAGTPPSVPGVGIRRGVMDAKTGLGYVVVKTPDGTVVVSPNTSVGVRVVPAVGTHVSAWEGTARVEAPRGRAKLGKGERTEVSSSGIRPATRLPVTPVLKKPADNAVFELERHERVSLRWDGVAEARSYRLQVARSSLFEPEALVVDVAQRGAPGTELEIEKQGSFYWHVAAISGGEATSDWSAPRRFQVLSRAVLADPALPAPELLVDRPKVIASFVVLTGRTTPGASVSVNDEPADVAPSGSFRKLASLPGPGFHTLLVKATSGGGRETVRRETVRVDEP